MIVVYTKTHAATGRNGGNVAQHDGLGLNVSLQKSNERLHDYSKLVPRSDVVVELGHTHHHLQSCDSHMITTHSHMMGITSPTVRRQVVKFVFISGLTNVKD